jgi:hypothetical protein
VIPSLEFAARVNKEIGQGSGDRSADGVTIVFMSNVDPMKLAAAKSRALPLPALPASNGTNGAHWWPPSRPRTDGPPTRRPPILRRRRGRRTVPASVEFEN